MNTETTQTNAVRWERKPVCCSKKFLQCLQSWWGEAWTKKSTKNRTEETHIGLNLTGTLKHENAHTCARTMNSACVSQDGMAVGRHGEGGEAGRQRVSNTAWCLSWYEGGHTQIHTPWECARKKVNNTDGDPNNEDVSAVMVSVMMRRGSWDDNSGNGNDGERRTQAGVGPSTLPRRWTPQPEWLWRYLGWPTLPGRRRWRTGGLRWRGWLSFGPPPLPPLKWPGSATAEHSYLERGAREGGVKPGAEAWLGRLAGPGQRTRGQHWTHVSCWASGGVQQWSVWISCTCKPWNALYLRSLWRICSVCRQTLQKLILLISPQSVWISKKQLLQCFRFGAFLWGGAAPEEEIISAI